MKEKLRTVETMDFLGEIGNSFIASYENGKIKEVSSTFGEIKIGSIKKFYKYLIGLLMSVERIGECSDIGKEAKEIKKIAEEIIFENFDKILKAEGDYCHKEITMNAFLSYFDFDLLAFREQILNHLKIFYNPFSEELEKKCGLKLEDFFKLEEIYYESFEVQKYLDKFKKLENDLLKNGELTKENIEILQDAIDFYMIKEKKLLELFGKEKVEKILELFVLDRKERDYKYFSDDNPYTVRPLCKVEKGIYMGGLPEQMVICIFYKIEEILMEQSGKSAQRYKQRKDKIVEEYFAEKIKELLEDRCNIYKSLSEDNKKQFEHDLIVEVENKIFICEIKGSKIREGNKNLDVSKTFTRIKDHFNSSSGIGKGYKQAMSLVKKFKENTEIVLYDSKGKDVYFKDCNKKEIIPVVLTLGQFGTIGINVSKLIDKNEEDPYPWVCSIYDLENIIKINKILKVPLEKIVEYLEVRSQKHENIYGADELDIYTYFLYNNLNFGENFTIVMPNLEGDLIDQIYYHEKEQPYEYNKINVLSKIKIGRNEPCFCGSGKKYKKCHGK